MSRRSTFPTSSIISAPSSSASRSQAIHTAASGNVTITHAPMEHNAHSTSQRHGGKTSDAQTSSLARQQHAELSREEARQSIVESLVQILEQPLSMLRDGTVSDVQMSAESKLIPGSTLGKHLRHVHDHYRVLLDSLEEQASKSPHTSSSSSAISLDYDKRMSIPPLETSAKAAAVEFEATQRRIRALLGDYDVEEARQATRHADTGLDRDIRLSATTPNQVELGSTLGREMWFVCLHAIHHYALARVILVHELGCKIDDSFGVAPSTLVLRAWRRAAQHDGSGGSDERQSKL